MVSSNIRVEHGEVGLTQAVVTGVARISPHLVRVTVSGDDLRQWPNRGYDHWFRLAVPTSEGTRFDNLSDRFDTMGYLRYLSLPRATRPVMRNYTVRELRPELGELDIDIVIHGDEGVVGAWAATEPVGDTIALIDQGCGYRDQPADTVLLVGDESALPAIVGILRSLDSGARGIAVIEVADTADRQECDVPSGMHVEWLTRAPGERPGQRALAYVAALAPFEGTVNAFAAGESQLATGIRRHLVTERGIPKDRVTFCGYWKLPKSAA